MTRLTLCSAFWAAFDALWQPLAVVLVLYLVWVFGPFFIALIRWSAPGWCSPF